MEDYDPAAQTQEQQQPTPSPPEERNPLLWGYLERYPHPNNLVPLSRYELRKDCPVVKIGRDPSNHIVIPYPKISKLQATIRWGGVHNGISQVTIEDNGSLNSTYIEGTVINRDIPRTLKNGSEFSFVVLQPAAVGSTMEDYRFIFHDEVTPDRGVLEKYQLDGALGSGYFSVVYKAYDKKQGNIYAVKSIHAPKNKKIEWKFSQNDDTVSVAEQQIIVQREIDMMKTLAHPNVCVLYEHFWNAEGSIDLVLEYMSGGDLHDFISKNKGLSERMTKHLMRQLCEALAFVHSKDVAHRDLKPENLLLTTDRPPVLKIADFGLAKVVSPGSKLVSICGTPMYLPPEFARHRIEGTGYGKELDCFSAGGIKFMCLTACSPLFSNVPKGEHRMEHVTLDRELDWQTLEHQKIGIDKEGYPIYLSSPGRRFIRGLMESDPDQRLTMVQALQHEWFRYDQADSYLPPTTSADTCDELTSSFQEVTFHTPKPAAEDAADHASAHNDTVTPASQDAQTSERLKNKGRALEHQRDVLKRTPPEMLQRVQLVFPTPVEECMPVMTAGPSGANKRKYSARTPPPAGDTDTPLKTPLRTTASASPDPEPLTKRGKSVGPDEMDVSPKKSRRRGGR